MDLTLTHALLAFGTAVVAPLALTRLHVVDRWVLRMATAAGALVAPSLAMPQGPIAAALALPWGLLAIGVALSAVPRTWQAVQTARGLREALELLAPLAALGFWVVGASWVLLDRLALDPVGVGADLVLLTAVHFHFAGLAATTIVSTSTMPGHRDGFGTAAVAGTLAAPVLVAVGFVAVPVLQVAGAIVFTLALLAWSLQAGPPRSGRAGAIGWRVARASVWASMPLAVWWATGFVTGWPAPSIPVMAATHGVANALGFSLCGLLALAPRDKSGSGDLPLVQDVGALPGAS